MLLLHLPVVISTSVVAYVYPLYASYKAITAPSRPGSTTTQYAWRIPRASPVSGAPLPRPGAAMKSQTELAELESWLMYWSIIAVIQTCETFFGWSWSWLPFYDEAKLLFTFWLVSPQTQGASYLYTNYMGPFLADHEHEIDAAVVEARTTLKQSVIFASQRAYHKVRQVLWDIPPPPEPTQPQRGWLNFDVPTVVDKAADFLGVAGASTAMDHVRSVTGGYGVREGETSDASSTSVPVGSPFGHVFAAGRASTSPTSSAMAAPHSPGPLNRSVAEQRREELQRELAEIEAQLQRAPSVHSEDSDAKQGDHTPHVTSSTADSPTNTPEPARRSSLFARWFARSSSTPAEEVTSAHGEPAQVVEEDDDDSAQSTALSGGYAVLRRTTTVPSEAATSEDEPTLHA